MKSCKAWLQKTGDIEDSAHRAVFRHCFNWYKLGWLSNQISATRWPFVTELKNYIWFTADAARYGG